MKSLRKESLILLMLITILVIAFVPRPILSQGTPVIGTQPSPCTALAGTNFDVNVTVADVQDLYGWILNVTFDQTVLHVVDMVEGPFLLDFADSLGISTWPLGPIINNDEGWVQMSDSLFSFEPLTDGADGDGVLATITFEVQVYGTSSLHFLDQCALTTNIGGLPTPMDYTAVDGWFDNRITGDANSDKTVNVFDVLAVKSRWGRTPASPDWIRQYDVNNDEAINVFDILTVKAHWGETAP